MALDEEELKKLEIRQKKRIVMEEHFQEFKNKNERNEAIIGALKDGYNQAEIARYLKLSASAIEKI